MGKNKQKYPSDAYAEDIVWQSGRAHDKAISEFNDNRGDGKAKY